MDFSMREKDRQAGPIDGLRRLTVLYREREAQLQRSGLLSAGNALGFDLNSSPGTAMGQSNGVQASNGLSESQTAQSTQQNGVTGRPPPGPSPKLPASKRTR